MYREVNIVEVGPRDGFQNIKEWIATDIKKAVITQLLAADLPEIQITSFVSPKAIEQMKDAEELAFWVNGKQKDTLISALIVDYKGAQRAVKAGITRISYALSANEAHNLRNTRRNTRASLQELDQISREFPMLDITMGLATAFGYENSEDTSEEMVLDLIAAAGKIGIKRICLSDTTGVANTQKITSLLGLIKEKNLTSEYSVHFHDNDGRGLANCQTAFELGVRTFEASVGGMGGCPFASNTTGNVATEDLVAMFENRGIYTGVSMEKILQTVDLIKDEIG